MGFYIVSCVCVCLPGDVAELYSYTLCHAPLLRKHTSILLLIVHQLPFDPGIAAINLVQPCDLCNSGTAFHQYINNTVSQMCVCWN